MWVVRQKKKKKKTHPARDNPPTGKKRRSSPNTSTSTSSSPSTRPKKVFGFFQLGLPQDQHITLPSPIANRRSPKKGNGQN
jgi:hypothetical protein